MGFGYYWDTGSSCWSWRGHPQLVTLYNRYWLLWPKLGLTSVINRDLIISSKIKEGQMKNSILVVSFVVVLCFALNYQVQATQGITEQDAKVLVDKALKIYNTGDVALIPEVYAPEYVLHVSGSAEDIVGRAGIKNWVEFVLKAYPDFNI